MEVELVHPSDPEKKVVMATNEHQVAAFKSVGFVDAAELKDKDAAEAKVTEDAAKAQAELKKKLEATEKELADTKDKLIKAQADLKAAKKATPAPAPAPVQESEGDK
jgi:septal ring factor EnvC (AmiA/AmiB activator)